MNSDIAHCRSLHKTHGKSYFFATKFFPKNIQEATYVLYAFFRVPDEIVDTKGSKSDHEVAKEIVQWKEEWNKTWQEHGKSNDPVLRASYDVFQKYKIPTEYADTFLDAMIQDVTVSRYNTYNDLKEYMYGSAAVVGRIMSHVIGFSSENALPYADNLGYAMQLTNFLRDIDDDYKTRGRIYMPLDELQRFGLSEDDIKAQKNSEQWQAFMQFQINRARQLYKQAEQGIPYLEPKGQKAVIIASRVYSDILREIEKVQYNIFNKRVKTSLVDKLLRAKEALSSI